MANKSAQNTSIFKKAFGLLKSDTAVGAGIKTVREGLESKVKYADEIDDLFSKYANAMSSKNKNTKLAQETLDELKNKGFKQGDGDVLEELLQFKAKVDGARADMKAFDEDPLSYMRGNMKAGFDYNRGFLKDYYTNATPAQKKARIGATVGAYAGGALGIRALSGGTLTRNSKGERDIAGIPFI